VRATFILIFLINLRKKSRTLPVKSKFPATFDWSQGWKYGCGVKVYLGLIEREEMSLTPDAAKQILALLHPEVKQHDQQWLETVQAQWRTIPFRAHLIRMGDDRRESMRDYFSLIERYVRLANTRVESNSIGAR